MDKLVYLYYVVLIVILFWGAKFFRRKSWNDEFMSLSQTKALQGFTAICIMFHHIGQKTCASWLPPKYIHPGLEIFVPSGYWLVGIFMFCSGYGLLKSYKAKPNYLTGFFGRRILPLILGFYTTGIIFLIARILMGEKMDIAQFFIYLSGLQLSNPNTWFVVVMPFLYLFFYFTFKFCKNEKAALWITCLLVLLYTILGTAINHNNWWMRGQWWYNCVHFFSLGLIFAQYEKQVVENVKKHYVMYVVLAFIGILVFQVGAMYTQAVFTYYGEDYHFDHIILRRWVCLLAQILESCSIVFFIFMLGLKIKIGNKVLAFMGSITLEFYLIHGLFIELFGFSFIGVAPSLYYIKNVALFVLVVAIPSVPLAVGLQKFDNWLGHKMTGAGKNKKEVSQK